MKMMKELPLLPVRGDKPMNGFKFLGGRASYDLYHGNGYVDFMLSRCPANTLFVQRSAEFPDFAYFAVPEAEFDEIYALEFPFRGSELQKFYTEKARKAGRL